MTPLIDAYYTELATRKETNAPEPPPEPVVVTDKNLDAIYGFWFGCDGRAEHLDGQRIQFWMSQSDETDAEVRRRFAHLLPVAASMSWDIEALTPRQIVGLVVLFDQFPRNLFRASGGAFAYDTMAREITAKLCRQSQDYTVAERFMLGLPLVHHEAVESQDRAVRIAAHEAVEANDDADRDHLRFALDQATRHRDVIRRFGRFPHRNKMLGRQSTPEEEAFMAQHGRGF